MKKYLQNRKLTEIQCYTCNEKCMKPTSEVKRNLKLDRKLFCSCKCSLYYANLMSNNKTPNYDISQHSGNRNDEYTLFRYALRSAKTRYKEFDLTLEDLKNQWERQKGICPYTSFQMSLRTYKTKATDPMTQASLDRIDSSKGYIKGNIEFVCVGINYLKSNFSKEQVITFLINFKNSDFSEDRTISSLEIQALDAVGSP